MEWYRVSDLNELKSEYKFKELRSEIKNDFKEITKVTFRSWNDAWIKIEKLRKIKLIDENNYNISVFSFFKTDTYEQMFYILNFKKGFDKELGITRYHYTNKELAKKWRRQMMKIYHSDSRKNFNISQNKLDEVERNINKIYNRLVGEA